VLTALAFGLWYGAIAARLAILVLVVVRRFPAPIWFLFLAAHAIRSGFLVSLQRDPQGYGALMNWTSPWMSGLAALAALEAFILITWPIPRFRNAGAILCALLAIAAVAGGWLSLPDVNRAAGAGLAVFLVAAVTIFDRFRDSRQGALYHAAALGGCALAAAVSGWTIGAVPAPGPSLISSGGVLACYVFWIVAVRGIDLTRRNPEAGHAKREMDALAKAAHP
jgi:hypothetical protein